jgi:hypothetical protein
MAPGAINDKNPPSTGTKSLPPTNTNPPDIHPDNQYPVDPATPAPRQQPPAAPTTPPQF